MTYNDQLDFWPSVQFLEERHYPFHVLLSGYLRASRTFELYEEIFKKHQIKGELLPFELTTREPIKTDFELAQLMDVLRGIENFQSIMVSDPFKQVIDLYVDRLTEDARNCNSVNMIFKLDDAAVGDNLDGRAFLNGVTKEGDIDFTGKSMLFFGCGGVSSAISVRLCKTLKRIGLIDISLPKMARLRHTILKLNKSILVNTYDRRTKRDFSDYDYFYNGTGLGKASLNEAKSAASPLQTNDILPETGVAFDASYTPAVTPFLAQLQARGFQTFNGLSHMLSSTSMHIERVTGHAIPYESIQAVYESIG
jgi:shikimate 5-dehydrogenase